MNLYSIRGGNKTELLKKQYTIGIGISLGNKWFTPENVIELVKWALPLTKDKVIIYVADSIHAINLEVRNRISFEKAKKVADKMGADILDDVKQRLADQLSSKDQEKILYVRWEDFVDESYKVKLNYLYSFYKDNLEFKAAVHSIVRSFTSKEKKNFTDSQINRLGDYLIEEIPECMNRVEMAGNICDAYAYPFDSEMARLIEKMQYGEIFPEIKAHIMYTEPKVLLEVS